MKAILISIQPKWCELIANGKKTVEVRKTRPKLATPFKVYIYCTKDEPLYRSGDKFWCPNDECGNGKVIGEFVCDKVDEYRYGVYDNEFVYHIPTAEGEKTCMEYTEAEEYGNGKPLYFWHISDLVIYDKPIALSNFYRKCKFYDLDEYDIDNNYCFDCKDPCGNGGKLYLNRPPQSWCYVEEVQ